MFRVYSHYVQSMFRVGSEQVQGRFRAGSGQIKSRFRAGSEYVQCMFGVCFISSSSASSVSVFGIFNCRGEMWPCVGQNTFLIVVCWKQVEKTMTNLRAPTDLCG